MKTADRIRAIARKIAKVRITKRRSKKGYTVFWCEWRRGEDGSRLMVDHTHVPTMKEAEQILLAKLRCFGNIHFDIITRRGK